ncbi:hypothetical protein HY991_03860 [Candidatus Micrarchaeota archaeon]|nr:hypothetical protein [Candidatus Micrarchaeota archaeon]
MKTRYLIVFGLLLVSLVVFGCVQGKPAATTSTTTTGEVATTTTPAVTTTTQAISGEVAGDEALEQALNEASDPDISELEQELIQ